MSDADTRRVRRAALSIGLWVGISSGVIVAIGIGVLIAVVLSTSRREGEEHGGGWVGGPAGTRDDFIVDIDVVVPTVIILGLIGVVLLGVVAAVAARRSVRPLGEALRRQRNFVADASHELRTPLTTLTSRVQVLQRRHDRGEDIGAGLTDLRHDADMMADVLNDLLIAAEGESIPDGNADVATAAAAAVAAVTTSAQDSEVSLTITVDQEAEVQLPVVTLVRILVALLDNAVQHSPARGTVSIHIGRDLRNVTVRVIDEGSGIEGISPDQVFERFARPRESGRPRSFGLGLSLVRDVARRAGGSIEVERSTTSGTTFLLTLPAHP
ncbi:MULTISPECIES: sensor histidine kinase KdpD [Microbacterium]|uniref:sensor histidine kinase n=1 Tax=Microbacterium TaxID=33882 RepID=UPI00051A43BA|nr:MULTISPECIES: HAMP domain-containing sensor histidine kinase [Microbacterium]MCE7481042.1 HAMP domain-containing histidine kinase [Microbacterium profundi]OIU86287.1 two-component sensor histidine kinase [Microbacterium sp. AR7-10]